MTDVVNVEFMDSREILDDQCVFLKIFSCVVYAHAYIFIYLRYFNEKNGTILYAITCEL
jgi:hypothetical protein